MLQVEALDVNYGDQLALRGVSLNIEAGEVVAVTGPNGAGKSTLIRAAAGVIPKSGGSIRVGGHELESLSVQERARYMAVVPQARNLPGGYTVYQTVLMGRTPHLNWLGQVSQKDEESVNLALARANALFSTPSQPISPNIR